MRPVAPQQRESAHAISRTIGIQCLKNNAILQPLKRYQNVASHCKKQLLQSAARLASNFSRAGNNAVIDTKDDIRGFQFGIRGEGSRWVIGALEPAPPELTARLELRRELRASVR